MGKIMKGGVEHFFGGGSGFEGGSNITVCTQEEYDALVAASAVEAGVYYFIADDGESGTPFDLDILDSLAEIKANTDADKIAGALAVKELDTEIDTLKLSFQTGCSEIARAISDMGVATAFNDSPTVMANNIRSINTDTDTELVLVQTKTISRSTSSTTISATSIDGYTNLTADDFVLVVDKVSAYSYQGPNNVTLTTTPTLAYNPSNGTITVSGLMKSQVNTSSDSHIYAYASQISVYVKKKAAKDNIVSKLRLVASGSGNQTYSVTSLDNYASLTVNNFIIATTSVSSKASAYCSAGSPEANNITLTPTLSYDASLGTITVSGATHEQRTWANYDDDTTSWLKNIVTATYNIYLVG